jgi:molecular chaperone HscC
VNRVSTTTANQTEVTVRVYQGEGRKVESNLFLGEFDVSGIPRGPAGQEIDIRFTYDLNGVLEVEATIVATQRKVSHAITRHARGMSPAWSTPKQEEPLTSTRTLSPKGRGEGIKDVFATWLRGLR